MKNKENEFPTIEEWLNQDSREIKITHGTDIDGKPGVIIELYLTNWINTRNSTALVRMPGSTVKEAFQLALLSLRSKVG